MSRIQDLGEACDDAIKTLRALMEENGTVDTEMAALREKTAIDTVNAYFSYSGGSR